MNGRENRTTLECFLVKTRRGVGFDQTDLASITTLQSTKAIKLERRVSALDPWKARRVLAAVYKVLRYRGVSMHSGGAMFARTDHHELP